VIVTNYAASGKTKTISVICLWSNLLWCWGS